MIITGYYMVIIATDFKLSAGSRLDLLVNDLSPLSLFLNLNVFWDIYSIEI